jgi:hypothetical protein
MQKLKSIACTLTLLLSACTAETTPSQPTATPTPETPTLETTPSSPSVPASTYNSADNPANNPANPATTARRSPIPNPVFEPILPELKQQAGIPVLLPDYLFGGDGASEVYAILETANPSQYRVMLAFTPDCTGGTACRLGEVTGAQLTPDLPPLEGKTVPLDNGISGYFVDAVCAANCSDATLSWEQSGGRYTVGIKAGKPENLVKMANSAIAAGPF